MGLEDDFMLGIMLFTKGVIYIIAFLIAILVIVYICRGCTFE